MRWILDSGFLALRVFLELCVDFPRCRFGSWILDLGSTWIIIDLIIDLRSSFLDLGSWILDLRYILSILVTWILDLFLDLGWILDLGSQTHSESAMDSLWILDSGILALRVRCGELCSHAPFRGRPWISWILDS